ncbi:cytochrome P450 [Novosphingobium bradum]|uniref:Cytochrome P450 n=1 Tax=Novosphingobium bradum TaxID=1737444 RepID=A0ABV7IJ50_9SPHN
MQIPASVARAIVDPKAYAENGPLDEAFAWLRAHAPLARIETPGYNPFWAVTRHADIREIERRSDQFLAGVRPTLVVNAPTEADIMAKGTLVRPITQMDDPDHAAYRALTQGWFVPQNLRKLEGRIREIARGFIDGMAARGGECDFARDVAFLYPLRVIMEILGVPAEDEPRMLKLTQELFGNNDPEFSRSGTPEEDMQVKRGNETVLEFIAYFGKVTEARRAHPTDDLSSVIANGTVHGAPLPKIEAMGYYVVAAAAGHDTTSNATSGGMWALCENPGQFARLKADPSLIPAFVEEIVRWTTPVKHFMRTAAQDVEYNGQAIAKGDWLMLCYHSGNRDEAVFENPFTFDIERKTRHIGYGFGPHVCLGQHLARLELRIFWEELLPRLESVELAGTPRRTEANFVCGPKSVPIRYRMT